MIPIHKIYKIILQKAKNLPHTHKDQHGFDNFISFSFTRLYGCFCVFSHPTTHATNIRNESLEAEKILSYAEESRRSLGGFVSTATMYRNMACPTLQLLSIVTGFNYVETNFRLLLRHLFLAIKIIV